MKAALVVGGKCRTQHWVKIVREQKIILLVGL